MVEGRTVASSSTPHKKKDGDMHGAAGARPPPLLARPVGPKKGRYYVCVDAYLCHYVSGHAAPTGYEGSSKSRNAEAAGDSTTPPLRVTVTAGAAGAGDACFVPARPPSPASPASPCSPTAPVH